MAKARMTVFSRFLLMMIIVGPLAFLGASYYNGEDGIQNIRNLFNGKKDQITNTTPQTTQEAGAIVKANTEATYEIRKLKEELGYKQKRLDEVYKENEDLKRKINQLEKQLGGD